MTKALCEVVESFSQVAFVICDIRDKMAMTYLTGRLDKGNNYWYQPVRLESEIEQKIDYEAVE